MIYSKYEQETTVVFNEETHVAEIYTAAPRIMRRLDGMCAAHPEVYKRIWTEMHSGRITAARYTVSDRFIRFGKPASAAQIAAAKASISKARIS